MKLLLKLLFIGLGLMLLWLVVREVDLSELGAHLGTLGAGIVLVFAVHMIAFGIDTVSWQVVLSKVPFRFSSLWELWKLRMVGSSYNQIVPVVGFGGEPLKVVLLKRVMGIGYREGTASVIAFETVNLLALAGFAAIAYAIAVAGDFLPEKFGGAISAGLGLFVSAMIGFFLFQRFRVASLLLGIVHRGWLRTRLEKALAGIRDVENWLVVFYTKERRRFAIAFALSIVHIVVGVLEIYVAAALLGHPIGFWSCWAIVGLIEVVKAGTFFIPIRLGAQEVAMVFVVGAFTGNPALGFSLAVVRRIRELFMILWGIAIGWRYAFQRRAADSDDAAAGVRSMSR